MKYKLDIQYFAGTPARVTYYPGLGSGEPYSSDGASIMMCTFTAPNTRGLEIFCYWTSGPNGDGNKFWPGDSTPIDTASGVMSLYAQWQLASPVAQITYDGNGGTGLTAPTNKFEKENCKIASSHYVKAGYAFIGWNTQADGLGTFYSVGQEYRENIDLLLYAQWGTPQPNIKFKYGALNNLPYQRTAGTLYFADNSDKVGDSGRLYFDISDEKRIMVGTGDALYVTNTTDEPDLRMYLVGSKVQGLTPGVSTPMTETNTNSLVYMQAGRMTASGYTSNGKIYIPVTKAGELDTSEWPLVIGTETAVNLAIDKSTIQARDNYNTSDLSLNPDGGTVYVGSGGIGTSGDINVTSGTASSSYSTGAVVVEGGVGIDGNLYFSGTLNGHQLKDVTAATFIGATDKYVTERAIYWGLPTINGSHTYDASTNIFVPVTTGGNGYVLVAKKENVGGKLVDVPPVWVSLATPQPTTDANLDAVAFIDTIEQNDSGKITVTKKKVRDASELFGGLVSTTTQNFAGAKTFTDDVIISSDTAASSFQTGALKVAGGVGVGGAAYVEGGIHSSFFGNLQGNVIGNASSASQVNHDLIIGKKHYNGSSVQEITSSDLAIAAPMVFKGVTLTNIECEKDPVTQEVIMYNTNPSIQLKGNGGTSTVTAQNGWAVIVEQSGNEYVWYETKIPTPDIKARAGKVYYQQTEDDDGNTIYVELTDLTVGQTLPENTYEDGGQWTPLGFASSYSLHNHVHGILNNAGFIVDEVSGTTYENRLLISNSTSSLGAGPNYTLKTAVTGDSSFSPLTGQTIYAAKDFAAEFAGRLATIDFVPGTTNTVVQLANVGDASTPVYFQNGVPVVCDGEIGGGGGGGIEIHQWNDAGTSYTVITDEPVILNRLTKEQYQAKTLAREIDPYQYYITDEVDSADVEGEVIMNVNGTYISSTLQYLDNIEVNDVMYKSHISATTVTVTGD